MRGRLWPALLAAFCAALLILGCGGSSLAGSAWSGDGLLTGNIKLTFLSDTECQLSVRSVGAMGNYTVADNQVKLTFQDQTYEFTVNGDTMKGYVYGLAVTLHREKS